MSYSRYVAGRRQAQRAGKRRSEREADETARRSRDFLKGQSGATLAGLWTSVPTRVPHVDVWHVDLDNSRWRSEALRSLLSPTERRRANGFRDTQTARRFVIRRAALRLLLAQRIGTSAIGLTFDTTCSFCGDQFHGKPRVRGSMIQFSVSSSGADGFFAVGGEAQLGMDVEHVARVSGTHASGILHDEEAAMLPFSRDDRAEFLAWIWSRKEAALKSLGVGLALDLTRFSVATNSLRLHTGDFGTWGVTITSISPTRETASALAVGVPCEQE